MHIFLPFFPCILFPAPAHTCFFLFILFYSGSLLLFLTILAKIVHFWLFIVYQTDLAPHAFCCSLFLIHVHSCQYCSFLPILLHSFLLLAILAKEILAHSFPIKLLQPTLVFFCSFLSTLVHFFYCSWFSRVFIAWFRPFLFVIVFLLPFLFILGCHCLFCFIHIHNCPHW